MAVEARRTLVWGTAAAAVASALLLTSNGGGLPRLGVDARAETLGSPSSSNRTRSTPAALDRALTPPRPGAR